MLRIEKKFPSNSVYLYYHHQHWKEYINCVTIYVYCYQLMHSQQNNLIIDGLWIYANVNMSEHEEENAREKWCEIKQIIRCKIAISTNDFPTIVLH